jgi:glutathione S-transferase
VTLEALAADVARLADDLGRVSRHLAELATVAGEDELAAAAAALAASLARPLSAGENPFMTRHRAWVEELRDRGRLSRGPRVP